VSPEPPETAREHSCTQSALGAGGLRPFWREATGRILMGMETLPHAAAVGGSRVRRLQASLRDERSGRVVFLSHCLLNENTRYLGGAFRRGAVEEVVDPYLRDGTGICQLPCPEQLAWGGVLKRRLLLLYGRPWLSPALRLLRPALGAYTRTRYRLLARRVSHQIADYRRSGFEVVGVVGVDASPTCGITTTLSFDASLAAVVGCPLARLDRRFMNDTVLGSSARPGRGLFIDALSDALARVGCSAPLLAHDLRSEAPGSPFTAGPNPAGVAGAPRPQRS
jgi:predicted secreted protein